jgi:porin
LSQYGLSLNILETSEVLGNMSGGVNQGFEYDGLTQMILQLDTQRAFHWYGGTFNVSALQIHGRNLSADNLGSLQTASGIEADRATRLWELWYDQKFDHEGRFDVKIGQQSLDQEFMVSQNALVFVNTMFGWPMVPSADMPGGGPAYPLSAPGVRARVKLADSWTLLAGVFSGSPAPNGNPDSQQANPSGTSFPLNRGALVIAELQYAYPSLGTMVYADKQAPLSRVYKLGMWYDTDNFDDQRFDNTGLSLANPASTGIPQTHSGDFSIYAVADQMIWEDPSDDDRNLNVFLRAMGTPQIDRNLIDFSLNAGLTFNEPFKHRDDDVFGIGMGYTHVSSRAADLDRDTGFFSGATYPTRGSETFVEVTYRYQLTPWCQLQPDFQYVFNPGGGIPNPNSASGQRVQDEAILGLRVNVAF